MFRPVLLSYPRVGAWFARNTAVWLSIAFPWALADNMPPLPTTAQPA